MLRARPLRPFAFDQADDRDVVEVAVAGRLIVEQMDAAALAAAARTSGRRSSAGPRPPARRTSRADRSAPRARPPARPASPTTAVAARRSRAPNGSSSSSGAQPVGDERQQRGRPASTPAPVRAAAPAIARSGQRRVDRRRSLVRRSVAANASSRSQLAEIAGRRCSARSSALNRRARTAVGSLTARCGDRSSAIERAA